MAGFAQEYTSGTIGVHGLHRTPDTPFTFIAAAAVTVCSLYTIIRAPSVM